VGIELGGLSERLPFNLFPQNTVNLNSKRGKLNRIDSVASFANRGVEEKEEQKKIKKKRKWRTQKKRCSVFWV